MSKTAGSAERLVLPASAAKKETVFVQQGKMLVLLVVSISKKISSTVAVVTAPVEVVSRVTMGLVHVSPRAKHSALVLV